MVNALFSLLSEREQKSNQEETKMKKMLAIMVATLFALSVTLAFAAEPVKTDTTAPAKVTDKAADKKVKGEKKVKATDKKVKGEKKDAAADKKVKGEKKVKAADKKVKGEKKVKAADKKVKGEKKDAAADKKIEEKK
jgi:hypothetical protein